MPASSLLKNGAPEDDREIKIQKKKKNFLNNLGFWVETLTAILADEGRPPSYSGASLTIPIRLPWDDPYLGLLMLDASGEAGV